MKNIKTAACICISLLTAILLISAPSPVYAATVSGGQTEDGRIWVDGALYSGHYMDDKDTYHIVSQGVARPKNGTVDPGTAYYSQKTDQILTLPRQTVFVAGRVYTGHYTNSAGVLYIVSQGTPTQKTGMIPSGTAYYSLRARRSLVVPRQTVFIRGRIYTGYYMDPGKKMYSVKNGTRTLYTGTLKNGTRYYSQTAGKTLRTSKKAIYIKGKVYTGYYMGPGKKMYSVKNGTCTPKTGNLRAGTRYYSSDAKKMRSLTKQTLYVKGSVYTGYYMDPGKRLYKVKKGTRSLKTGMVDIGTRYYSHNAKKMLRLKKRTLYVKGTVYTGYYLTRAKKMYSIKKGTQTLHTGLLGSGTAYYDQASKKIRKLSGQRIYINGKIAEGMSAESFATFQKARAIVKRITNDRMTKEEKLKVCFDHVKRYQERNPRLPHYTGMDWPVIYANDMFENGIGNCCSYAAAFAYMARAVGYEEVYCCNSGGHGWAEIDGLIYDPEWSLHHHVHSYYALSYNTPTDQNYRGAIAAGRPWMHIKI